MTGLLATIAALLAVAVWFAFVVQTVLSLAEPSAARLLLWAVAIPVVVALEAGCLWTLERFHRA